MFKGVKDSTQPDALAQPAAQFKVCTIGMNKNIWLSLWSNFVGPQHIEQEWKTSAMHVALGSHVRNHHGSNPSSAMKLTK